MATNTQSPALRAGQPLTAMSGQNYSSFSSSMVQGAQLFMNNFANQTGGGARPSALAWRWPRPATSPATGTAPPSGAPGAARWAAWARSAAAPAGAVTYNVGGFAAGLDRHGRAELPCGVTVGYTTGTQWTSGFSGQRHHRHFPGRPLRQLQRGQGLRRRRGRLRLQLQPDVAADLHPRPAAAHRAGPRRTNQWYGQVETGYRFDLGTR